MSMVSNRIATPPKFTYCRVSRIGLVQRPPGWHGLCPRDGYPVVDHPRSRSGEYLVITAIPPMIAPAPGEHGGVAGETERGTICGHIGSAGPWCLRLTQIGGLGVRSVIQCGP